ncbi:MAG: hypothetical protein NT148_02135, partial [Candidatus Nealsonbacteria bacterium]|nr:hypothetical protein [Candidatus Nealsonbacteria bacterium]
MRKNKWSLFLIVSYILIAACYTLYSFSQIDLNLTLSSNGIYQSFQKVLIRLGYFNRPLSTLFYILIVFLFFTVYSLLFISFKKKRFSLKKLWWLVGLTIGFLIISYPALSHDIFNYMFNAKMVLLYRRNPHIYVALNFPHDTWVRFMHNVHTPAPYFYGWTVLSLIPSVISLNKIIPNIINFKLFEIPFFVWQIYLLNKILGKLIPEERLERLFLFVLNPLVLIEVFGNGHNDLTMTSLALGSLWFLIKEEKISIKNFLLSIFFLLLSASIKYVTIILLPVYLIYAYIRMRYSASDPDLVGRVEKYRNIFYSRLVRQLADFARTIINDIGGCAAIIL